MAIACRRGQGGGSDVFFGGGEQASDLVGDLLGPT